MVGFNSLLTALLAVSGVIAAPENITEPFALLRRQSTPSATGMHNGYYFSWWTDGASPVTYNNLDGGSYSVRWQSGGNFVGGKGWKTGSRKEITYSGTWTPVNNGNAYLCVYGWTRNPLVEYYILDNFGEYNPGGSAQAKGQVVDADGSVYMLYTSQRVQQPSIEGTATFSQYWAIRQEKRTGGTIDTGVFFDAWEKAGLRMGTHDYMIVATEGYRSAGQSAITVETPP